MLSSWKISSGLQIWNIAIIFCLTQYNGFRNLGIQVKEKELS